MTNVLTSEHKAFLEKATLSHICIDNKEHIGFEVQSWNWSNRPQELRDLLDWGMLKELPSITAFGFTWMTSLIVITDRGQNALDILRQRQHEIDKAMHNA